MLRPIVTALFIYLFAKWLSYEYKPASPLRAHIKWIIAALLLQIAGSIISRLVGGDVGNFLLHAIGGGVVSTMLFLYLVKTFGWRVSWRVELVLLFAFVSALGVLNEFAEYALELITSMTFALDTHDTWRDFTANTTGAMLAWLIVRASKR